MSEITVRSAREEDAERLLEIYAYYVEHTAITFEYETPSLPEFRRRIRNTLRRYPYLVAEQDGAIQGYAYAGSFVGRAAYDWSCELSIYLDRHARRCGLGRTLYGALEERLRAMGILNLYACIACPREEDAYLTRNSVEFHQHLGFFVVGEFHRCGYKFGRWYNMVWAEKILAPHRQAQQPVAFGGLSREERTPVVTFTAYSGVGKTTYLEKLIPCLRQAGLRVAVVKHDEHGFQADREGKDSWRFSRAGADAVAVAAPEQFALFRPGPAGLEEVLAHVEDMDLILTEGFKRGPFPKVALYREGIGGGLTVPAEECLAIVGDYPGTAPCPVFPLDQPQVLADYLLELLGIATQDNERS